MKKVIPGLAVGDTVVAKVIEKTDGQNLIVSFYGDLLRLNNQSQRSFALGESIRLEVTGVEPLQFRIALNYHSGKFDITV